MPGGQKRRQKIALECLKGLLANPAASAVDGAGVGGIDVEGCVGAAFVAADAFLKEVDGDIPPFDPTPDQTPISASGVRKHGAPG